MDLSGIGQYDSSSSEEEECLSTLQRAATNAQISKSSKKEFSSERGVKRTNSHPQESVKRSRLSNAAAFSQLKTDSNVPRIQHMKRPEKAPKSPAMQQALTPVDSVTKQTDRVVPPPPIFSPDSVTSRDDALDRPPSSTQRGETRVNIAKLSGAIFVPPQLLLKRPNIPTEDEDWR